ncbi:unnamed protein product [Moneuplotes crassus]|uniref:Uncharacterized protein n=1 Tax=Euplotes crassus TaxID=5936 RepID=A0AAD1U3K5_EUPCR|nr:unnamed protein product [Moneuplotes crassus]
MKKVVSFLRTSIVKSDLFPQKVSLTYKGKSSFQTLCGGILSLIITAIIIGYSVRLFVIMFRKQETSKSLNRVYKDIQNYPEDFDLDKDTFVFTFMVRDTATNQRYFDPSYITVSVTQQTHYYNLSAGARTIEQKERPFSTCNDRFPIIDEAFSGIRDLLKNNTKCLDDYDFTVRGSVFSSIWKFMTLSVSKCVNGTSSVVCKTPAEIEQKLKTAEFLIGFTSRYFDFNDYENPIKTTFDTRFSASLDTGFLKTHNYDIQKHEVEDINYFFQFGQSDKSKFYRVGEEISDFRTVDSTANQLLEINIHQDSQVLYYERTIFSFFDVIGSIGGVFGLLLQAGLLLTNNFSEKYFLTSLFSFLYISDISKKECNLNLNKNVVRPKNSQGSFKKSSNQNETIKPLNVRENSSTSETPASFKKLSDNYHEDLKAHLMMTRRVKFTRSDYCKTLLPFFLNKPKREFEELSDKLSQELDVVEIIHSVRAIKVIMKLMLKEHQQKILSFSTQGQSQLIHIFTDRFNDIPLRDQDTSLKTEQNIDSLIKKLRSIDENEVEKDIRSILDIPNFLPKTQLPLEIHFTDQASKINLLPDEEHKEDPQRNSSRNKTPQLFNLGI